LLASQRYGDSGAAAVMAWRDLLTQAAASLMPPSCGASMIFQSQNPFWRRQRYLGQAGLLGDPLEVLGRGQGDCEDFAIAKYVTLKLLGIPSEKLRLTYVKPASADRKAHLSRPIWS